MFGLLTAKSVRLLSVVFLLTSSTVVSAAAFTLDFTTQPIGTDANGDTVSLILGGMADNYTAAGSDGTRFVQQLVTINNVPYFHVITSDQLTGQTVVNFQNEFYVPATMPVGGQSKVAAIRAHSPASGGNEFAIIGDIDTSQSAMVSRPTFGNARNPFGLMPGLAADQQHALSGNGTGDPTSMIMRLLMTDGDLVLDMTKPTFANKPRITQSISQTVAGMESLVDIDLNGLDYNTSPTATESKALVTNSLMVDMLAGQAPGATDGVDFDATGGNFDIQNPPTPSSSFGAANAVLTPNSTVSVSAGRYIYVPGTAWNTSDGWDVIDATFDEGTYIYDASQFSDVLLVNWGSFFIQSSNLVSCSSLRRFAGCEIVP